VKIAIIADIHEDAGSLRKALEIIEKEKCDEIVCLGDILGFSFYRANYAESRDASACIALLKKNCSLVLPGNHDLFHLKKLPQSGYGFNYPENWYELNPAQMLEYSKGKVWNYTDDLPVSLSNTEFEYLNSLPEFVVKKMEDKNILFSHFVYPNFVGYESSLNGNGNILAMHFNFLKKNSLHISFCGHTHIEGLGLSYDPEVHVMSRIFKGFRYYPYGKRKLKPKRCSISVPALADNRQSNGFLIYDTSNHFVEVISLNINRRILI
jgi:predicted phosphodiesterase